MVKNKQIATGRQEAPEEAEERGGRGREEAEGEERGRAGPGESQRGRQKARGSGSGGPCRPRPFLQEVILCVFWLVEDAFI